MSASWLEYLRFFRFRMVCHELMTGVCSAALFIIYVIKHGLQWKDAPKAYGPHKTLYNRFVRWSLLGVFDRIFTALSRAGAKTDRIMIDATHLKAHRTAASLAQKGAFPGVWAGQKVA